MTLDLPPEALQVGLAVDVVAFAMHADELQVLLIERADHPGYWQSVTGSRVPTRSAIFACASLIAKLL